MQTRFANISLSAILLGMAACTTTPRVTSRRAAGADLTRYRTFALEAGQIEGPDGVPIGNETAVGQLLQAEILRQLTAHGLRPDSQHPDLRVKYEAAKRTRHSSEEWKFQEGAVLIEAIDSKSAQPVWWAHIQGIIDPKDKAYRRLKNALAKAFKTYPQVPPPS